MSTHGKMGSFDAARESWTSYAERLEFYFAANGVTDIDTKKAIFVTVVGTQSYSLLKSLLQPQTPQTATLAEMKTALEKHFCPKPSFIVQRYRFHTRTRKTTESVATYVAELRAIGEHCAFGDTLEDMIRDRLVCGINNPRIQRRLLQEPDLSYDKAFEKAQSMETAAQDVVNMSTENKLAPVHNIRNKSGASKHADTTSFARVECYRCGGNHYATKCKFIDADCRKCGKKGHLARVCRSVATSKKPQMGKSSPLQSRTLPAKPHFPTHTLDLEPHPLPPPSPDSDYSLFTFPSKSKPIVITMQVNNATLPMELDTGASLSLISEATYKALSLPALSHTDIILSTYTGEKISPLGCIDVKVMYQSQEATLPLLVVAGEGPNLIGRNWLDYLKLDWSGIKTLNSFSSLGTVLDKHTEVFHPHLGKLRDVTAKLYVKSDARPHFFRPRSVAHSLKEKVVKELDRLQELGVITPVTHSEWAAPIVPILKGDGSIRICGDYKVTVNPVLLIDSYPLPRIEDLFASLSGGTIFSKLDLKHAYLQVPLDEESKKYTTINTSKGLFQYNRLPFGIASAPSLFQRIMENILSDIPKVSVYLDDILVTGKDSAEHLYNLHRVLQRLESAGLTLKKSKCTFEVSSVEYLGHIIDAKGLHPSESKVRAIRDAPSPTNITELKSFLGLLNYYHKFLPNLATTLAPLHQLLHKETKWKWTQDHENSFQKAKSLLHSSSLLVHYDPVKPLSISCDASPYGLGAILSHQMDDGTELPVAFASRTLAPAEKRYSQLEKEALAIIFAVRKFHDYIYGRHFTLFSDHKPLQYLLNEAKPLPTLASSRIQRWAITLSAYSYTIKHKPGKQLSHADALSRLPLADQPASVPTPPDVVLLLNHLTETIVSAETIKSWTDKDPVLSRLRNIILTGTNIPHDIQELQPFIRCSSELSVTDGCLLRGSRVIVPSPGHSLVLSQLHETHPGISRMKSLARCYVWWPGIDKDIENVVATCQNCQENSIAPPQSVVHPWECPKSPWIRVHVDHAGPFMGHYFLILVDAYSRWIEVHQVPSITTETTVKTLRLIFSIHGLPMQLVSDNGPAFTSHDFKEFINRNGIRHTLTAPYHPRSNGLAERAVQTFKSTIKKMEGHLHERIPRFLLQYRITPQTTTGQSPAQLLMGRKLRTVLDLIHPDLSKKVQDKQEHTTSRQPIRSFQVGDNLFARNYSGTPCWIPVIVTKVTGPLSYWVETTSGKVMKRHTDQLRKRHIDVNEICDEDETDECDDFPTTTDTCTPPLPPPIPTPREPPPLRRSSRPRARRDFGPYVG